MVRFSSPLQARQAGIETVYQTLAMSPALSITDNMFMGRELRKPGVLGKVFRQLDRKKMERIAREKLNERVTPVAEGETPGKRCMYVRAQAVETSIIHIQRLRLADGQPILFEERFLNAQLCPDLVDEDIETQSIHWLLVHKYKLPLVRVTHTVEMREVGDASAQLLNLQPADQIFAIERLTHTRHNHVVQPAVYYRALCHGEEYQFKAQFNTMI